MRTLNFFYYNSLNFHNFKYSLLKTSINFNSNFFQLKMATSVRLNLRVKSLFLEHTYNSISDKQEDTNISEAFKFLVCLNNFYFKNNV